jgi:predicted  nucleic acid-binding Zn-ribbon protein
MNVVLQNLSKLQALEFGEAGAKNATGEAEALRGVIPQPFLGHYDRMRARGKKGLAAVRNQVCTGCHMKQPPGKIATILRGEDIQLCDSCGRYLYVPPETPAEPAASAAEAKKPAKPRKRRTLVHA